MRSRREIIDEAYSDELKASFANFCLGGSSRRSDQTVADAVTAAAERFREAVRILDTVYRVAATIVDDKQGSNVVPIPPRSA